MPVLRVLRVGPVLATVVGPRVALTPRATNQRRPDPAIPAAFYRLRSGWSRYCGCYSLRWPVMTPFMNSHIGL